MLTPGAASLLKESGAWLAQGREPFGNLDLVSRNLQAYKGEIIQTLAEGVEKSSKGQLTVRELSASCVTDSPQDNVIYIVVCPRYYSAGIVSKLRSHSSPYVITSTGIERVTPAN